MNVIGFIGVFWIFVCAFSYLCLGLDTIRGEKFSIFKVLAEFIRGFGDAGVWFFSALWLFIIAPIRYLKFLIKPNGEENG